jgi:hypothetical protein
VLLAQQARAGAGGQVVSGLVAGADESERWQGHAVAPGQREGEAG